MLRDGYTAVVTGASRGIGLAIATALVNAGARTWLLARNQGRLEAAAGTLGSRAIALRCDVGSASDVAEATARIEAECGGAPDLLVNNAGLFPLAPIESTSADEFAKSLEVNLVAPFRLTRAVLPAMRRRGSGHIVLIGSIADRYVFPGNAGYSAAKFGARAMHEVLRLETRGSGVRATMVSPAATDTEIWDPYDPDNREGFTKRAEMLQADAVAAGVLFAVSQPPEVNIDELRLSRA